MKISDSEMEIMRALWQLGEPASAAQLSQALSGKGWKHTTLLTFLSRLAEKGAIAVSKEGRSNRYTPLISESDYKALETRDFLRQIHGGSVESLMASLCDSQRLTPQELRELAQWFEGRYL